MNSDNAVQIRDVVKRFGEYEALSKINLEIRKGEFFSLLGPSGCGKTTLLRIIAGLETEDEGEVLLNGKLVRETPPNKRPVNTVFQSYALFPHMTVFNNIAFGLKMKGIPSSELAGRVEKIMEVVQITKLKDRKPAQLSGGQQQRVALARAVVNEPEVLLLDEPLGALDLKLRKELQIELISLQKKLGICFILVTHDQEEALTMSDRIAVMNQGRIEQLGNAEEIYEYPRTKFVSQFLGTSNIWNAELVRREGESGVIATSVGNLTIRLGANAKALKERDRFNIAIRPEKVTLDRNSVNGGNSVPVRVEQLIYIGSETHYILKGGEVTFAAEVMNSKSGSQGYEIGDEAKAQIPADGLIVLED